MAVLTLSHQHAERLLTSKPLKTMGTAIADPKRPLLSATVFDWPVLVDVLTPWAEYAASRIIAELPGQEAQGKALLKEVAAQIRMIADVLKVYKGTTTATYIEDGKRVTHSVTVIRDLEK